MQVLQGGRGAGDGSVRSGPRSFGVDQRREPCGVRGLD